MTERAIIRARIAELAKMITDLQARLRVMEIEKALIDLARERVAGAETLN